MPGRALFGEALDALRVDVDVIGAMAQDAVAGALGALIGSDQELAQEVVSHDDRLDALFVALEERAYALVAQQAPVATDLRFLMSALRVMADYEKTGDRAVAVAKAVFAEWDREATTLSLLGRMGDQAMSMLSAARKAWLEQDLAVAAGLNSRDDSLDECYRALVSHLLSQDGPHAANLALHAHAAGRNIERIADHAVMIGDRVSYLLTGDPSALAAEIR